MKFENRNKILTKKNVEWCCEWWNNIKVMFIAIVQICRRFFFRIFVFFFFVKQETIEMLVLAHQHRPYPYFFVKLH